VVEGEVLMWRLLDLLCLFCLSICNRSQHLLLNPTVVQVGLRCVMYSIPQWVKMKMIGYLLWVKSEYLRGGEKKRDRMVGMLPGILS